MTRKLLISLLLGACAVPFAGAQSPDSTPETRDDDPYRLLSTVLVTSSAADAKEVAGSVSFLSDADLSAQAQTDVLRVLRSVPGVNIQEEDGFGLRPNIGLRGSGSDRSSRIVLMEDGVPISPAPYASPSAYYFPTTGRMHAIEVTKGPAAVRYGPRTTGGAINLFSTPVPDDFSAFGQAFFGTDDRQRVHAWVGGREEVAGTLEAGGLLEVFHDESDGFKRLDSGGPTGFDADDIVLKFGLYNEDAALPQSLEFKYQSREETSHETYLGLTLDDFRASPYRRYDASGGDEFNGENELFQLTHKIEFSPEVSLTTIAYSHDFNRNWYKLQGVSAAGLGASGDVGISAILADPTTYSAEFDLITGRTSLDNSIVLRANRRAYSSEGVQSVLNWQTGFAGADHDITVGVRLHQDEEDRFQEEDAYRLEGGDLFLTDAGVPGSQANRVSSGDAVAIFIEDRIRWGRLTVTPGVRIEDYELTRADYSTADPTRALGPTRVRKLDDQVVVPGIGVLYQATDDLTLLAGVHKGFAIASPGNTTSDAEESINFEAGGRYSSGTFDVEAIAYFNDYSNLLGVCTNSSGGNCVIGDQFDGGEVDVKGLELTAGWDAASVMNTELSLPLSLVYTWTDAEFQEDFASSYEPWGNVVAGDRLPYVPEHQLTISAGVEAARWGANLVGNYVDEARARAGQGAIPAGERIDSRWVADASIWYDVTESIRLRAKAENLFDEVYAASIDPAGLRPGKPQEILVGLELSF
ncbi:TonB-dependent receptor family protein [Henriciella litoralis]|uniref:TonB-dependent receptor family protein n=1 Tax=Henriciella litoralis TaxID=568102 RepID=UPI00146F7030|nr:TonB-dependent receptor [Henriciella litoralis]